ncbi:MAG: glycosyltransferase family 2 protein [Microcystaceae cyanobacterium]
MSSASVSVIIPCYCCASTIERALLSVIAQTLPIEEIIFVNDASTDNTEQVLDQLISTYYSYSIKKISSDINSGPGHARNVGWEAATSDYIAFLDSDDSWHPNKIEIQYTWMKEHPNVSFSGHPRIAVSEKEKENLSIITVPNVKNITKQEALLFSLFPTSSLMLKRAIPLRFNPQKRYCEDSLLWRELILANHHAVILSHPLAYRFKAAYGEQGLSQKLWTMEINELDSYYQFWRSGYLNLLEWGIFSTWSLTKHSRRLILSTMREFLKSSD